MRPRVCALAFAIVQRGEKKARAIDHQWFYKSLIILKLRNAFTKVSRPYSIIYSLKASSLRSKAHLDLIVYERNYS